MAFRIREITIHLTGGPGPCMPASPDPLCTPNTKPTVCMGESACAGKSHKPHPQGDPPGGPKKRSLDLLQARLRETLAPPPL